MKGLRAMEKEKIEELGLEDLKKYACPKNQHKKEWYLDCLNDCPGFATCKVGHRVMAILDSSTRHEEKPEKKHMTTAEYQALRAERSKEDCKTAIASGDPYKWLLEHGRTKKAAQTLLSKWKRKYYDLFGYAVPPVATGPYKAVSERRKAELIERIKTAVASGDVIEWLMAQGKTRQQAVDTRGDWKRKYPELFENYGKEQKTMNEIQHDTEDEISLESFISEFGQNPPLNAAEGDGNKNTQPESENGILGQLEAKYEVLKAEWDKLREEIKEKEERVQWLDEQLSALASVRNLFSSTATKE